LIAEGRSVREIAAALGISPSKVRYWLTKWRLKTRASTDRSEAARARRSGARRMIRTCKTHGATDFVLEGRGYYRCTRCRQERVAEWRRRVKARLVAEAGGACALCGYARYLGALEFHHRDPTQKEFGLAFGGVARSVDRLRAEAGKCVLLCSNCHAEVEGGISSIAA
jgi:hypothetical protein